MNKRAIVSVCLVLILALGFSACSSSKTNTNTNTGTSGSGSTAPAGTDAPINDTPAISIENFSFVPDVLTISAGTTVVWTNNDATTHTVVSADFRSGDLAKGDTFEFTYDKAGTYDFSCGIHPTMTGQVVVK